MNFKKMSKYVKNLAIQGVAKASYQLTRMRGITQNDRGLTLLEYLGVGAVVICIGILAFIAIGPSLTARIHEIQDVINRPNFGATS
ncbi:hypothetical protein ABEV55_16140 [Aneurinibacillus thermoaerophilus]|uniref:hypothetical protein n=1 Tax=Aneurinibacillus thermoaerophilus TaxID=143495 RepID=UPI002E20F715|nr:hypothetical protein [Aneurinibacillus thermoaerophilus]